MEAFPPSSNCSGQEAFLYGQDAIGIEEGAVVTQT